MRVGNEERERVVAALRKQFADGKLSLDDFGDRVEAAYAAVTADDLYLTVGGLDVATSPASVVPHAAGAPAPPAPPAVPARPPARRDKAAIARKSFYGHLGPYVVVNAFLVMIYVITSFGGYFWPIWPMMGWGVGLGIHAWAAFVVARDD
jgi:hypothetical protein